MYTYGKKSDLLIMFFIYHDFSLFIEKFIVISNLHNERETLMIYRRHVISSLLTSLKNKHKKAHLYIVVE